jgi:hypothetical protein
MIGPVMAAEMRKLRRPDLCATCRCDLARGSYAWWDAVIRTVTCAVCYVRSPEGETRLQELDRGVPGASAAGEYQRRRLAREADVTQARSVVGHVLSARRAPPEETAFRRGEQGELAVAGCLERRTQHSSTILLHDRRMPGGHGNIDHLAVTSTGVFVIDAKRYRGKVGVGRGFQSEKLFVNGRDRKNVLDGLDRQVKVVRAALSDLRQGEVAVQGILCFAKRNFAPGEGKQAVRGHLLLRPRPLARRLRTQGSLASEVIDAVALALAEILPSAWVADASAVAPQQAGVATPRSHRDASARAGGRKRRRSWHSTRVSDGT